jgi:ABC-type nitrate/sulfonate/bicarbonate transport system substrate-binding protein/nitrogen-specific signal transduction histidine kinase
MKQLLYALLLLLVSGSMSPRVVNANNTNLRQVTLQLKWTHSFQFAGYYMAKELGFYKDAGLDVTLRNYVYGMDVVEQVSSGQAQYGIGTSSLLISRFKGKPVVVLAPIFQHSPLVIIVPRASGLQSIHDLANKRIMIDPLSHELLTYLSREGISQNKFTLVNHVNIQNLIDGKVDAAGAYISEQPFLLNSANFKYDLFSPRSAGIDFYGDNVFTTEEEIKKHPDRAKAFLAATIKGWEYALEHPEETIRIIETRYGSSKSTAGLRYEASQITPLVRADQVGIGYMYLGRWQHIAAVYAEAGILPKNFDLTGFLYDPDPETDHTTLFLSLSVAALILLLLTIFAASAQRKNRQLKRALIAEEKLRDEQARFLSMLEHELRNPMAVLKIILTNPSLRQESKKLGGRTIQEMESLLERCAQMDRLDQKNILLHNETVDLQVTLQTLIVSMSNSSHVRLKVEPEKLDSRIESDPLIIRTIFSNLLDNAIKYCADHSDIEITLQVMADDSATLGKKSSTSEGIQIVFANQIGGAGAPDPIRLFSKFYRAPGTSGRIGSGLGLYLVKGLCEKLNGTIHYQRTDNIVMFIIRLPLSPEPKMLQ